MTGFELVVKGEKTSAALKEGVVSIILTKVSNEVEDTIDLVFTGLNTSNSSKNEITDWYNSTLESGDEIIIKITKVKENSTPIRIEEQSEEAINSQNIRAYYQMKMDLENKGLI